jgi:endonuclease-8
MPEGDTVWNTARVLDQALAGKILTRGDLRVPELATVDLVGWTVLGCASRGKHLLLRLAEPRPVESTAEPRPVESTAEPRPVDSTAEPRPVDSTAEPRPDGGRLTLRSHLRMDGTWRIYRPGEPWRGRPAHLIRAVLGSRDAVAVGYHLHDLDLVPTAAEETLVGHLGPDLLGPESQQPGGWDAAEAVGRLRRHPDATIGEALLDQRNLAGIGNLYRAEVLFLRGVHPETKVSTVEDLPAMVALARRLLMAHRGRWRQATTGSLRKGEEVYVYGRGGAPCRRCGTPIRRADLGERTAFWCPRCQPAPPSPTTQP